jgi:hypothetical protein
MEDTISFIETEQINDKIAIVLRQTDYTNEEAREKLREFNYDHTKVIKNFLGISTEKKALQVKSLNQEIYRQLRNKLDSNMQDYHKRVEKGDVKKII